MTADRDRACLAGWSGCYSDADPQVAANEVQQGLFARSQGLLSQHLTKKRVLVVGTGSVGSYMAELLVRSGLGAIALIDPETVEAANLCRTTYDLTDLGRPKVEAIARRLLNINPLLDVTLQAKSLMDFDVAEFEAMVQEADLVVAATDDTAAQRIINRFAYFHGKPTLFVGLYRGAEGGEVIFTIPDRTPCYLCATANRHKAESDLGRVSADADYGNNGRVMGEVAIAADIHHVTSAAVKIALSLLLPEDEYGETQGFLESGDRWGVKLSHTFYGCGLLVLSQCVWRYAGTVCLSKRLAYGPRLAKNVLCVVGYTIGPGRALYRCGSFRRMMFALL